MFLHAKAVRLLRTGRGVSAKRIAVSYDHAVYLDLLDDGLTAAGYETHLIRGQGGGAGHEQLRNLDPDLIIVDIHVNRSKPGWQVLDRIRRDPVLSTKPVIVCAADRRKLERQAGYVRHGGGALLPKPFAMDDLLSLVHHLVGNPA